MKAFITGGSGFVGKSLIEYLFSKHPEYSSLVSLSRSVRADEIILNAAGENKNRVEIVRGDLCEIPRLTKQLQGCEVVFHIAAKVDIWGKWEEFVEANITGTQNLLTAAKAAGVKRFIHVSTEATLLRGFQDGSLVNIDENTPLSLNPPFYAPYTQSKAMAEKIVVEANDEKNNFVTIAVRPRFVWGKGDTKLLPEIKKAISDGRFAWFTPEIKTSTCHIENLCEGMVLAVTKGKPGNVYFLTDGEPVIMNDFLKKLLANSLDINSVRSLSSTFAWYLAVFLENIPFVGFGTDREPPLNRQVLGLLAQDVIISDAKARKELGYTSHMSIERGIEEYLAAEGRK